MERIAAACISTGDHRARVLQDRDTLIETHLKLVPPIARSIKKHLPPSFDLDDLISEGNIGLMHAASRYQPKAHGGTPFGPFARKRIHGAIVDSVRRKAWTENTANPLEDAPELAEPPVLPYLIGGPRTELVPRRQARPSIAFDSSRLPKRLATALRRLSARQRVILATFYGEDRSIPEIAELLALTAEQAAAEHGAALKILHAALLSNLSIIGSAYYFATRISERRAA